MPKIGFPGNPEWTLGFGPLPPFVLSGLPEAKAGAGLQRIMRCIFGCTSGAATNNALHFWLHDGCGVWVCATQRIFEHFAIERVNRSHVAGTFHALRLLAVA
jgi:hypothetical protein